MINLGEINKLTILRSTDNGFYLIDEEENEVLLPNNYIEKGWGIGDEVEVFVFKDSLLMHRPEKGSCLDSIARQFFHQFFPINF